MIVRFGIGHIYLKIQLLEIIAILDRMYHWENVKEIMLNQNNVSIYTVYQSRTMFLSISSFYKCEIPNLKKKVRKKYIKILIKSDNIKNSTIICGNIVGKIIVGAGSVVTKI